MSEHTPGPWRLSDHGYKIIIDKPGDGYITRDVCRLDGSTMAAFAQRANARLIVASPILYAALAPLAAMITRYENNCGARDTYTLQLGAAAAKQIVDAVKAARGGV